MPLAPAAAVEAGESTAAWFSAEKVAEPEEATVIRLVVKRAIRSSQITPIFEDLGINIVSFDTERDPAVHAVNQAPQGKRHLQHFKGTFLVTDDDGLRLSDELLQQLVEALQRTLNVSITAGSAPAFHKSDSVLRKSDSVSSQLSVASDVPNTNPCTRMPSLTGSEAATASPNNTNPFSRHSLPSGHRRTGSQLSQQSELGDVQPATDTTAAGHRQPRLPGAGNTMQAEFQPGIVEPPPGLVGMQHYGGWMDCPTRPGDGRTALFAGPLSTSPGTREEESVELAAGQQTVDRIMNSPVHSIHKDADLNTAKSLMHQLQVSSLLVDTASNVPGFITKRDFLKVSFSKTLRRGRVSDIMTQPVICIQVGTSLRDAVRLIALKGVRRVLVYDPSRESATDPLAAYVGLVSDTDIFRVLGRPEQTGRANAQLPPMSGPMGHSSPISEASRQSVAASLAHYQSNISSISGMSVGSLAYSISSISEQAKAISTEDRLSAAAALWELDYNEIETMRKIGEGSFGEVVLASFRGTKVAVKRMRGFEISGDADEPGPSPTMMPVFAQFFEREIEIMASIRHPNVVNFIGACHTPPNVCLVTEYCARGSLDHLLHKSGLHLDLTKKIEFGMDIARGMSCLHAQRPAIVHRDLKPANLLVSARFEVKVADFGLSRIKDHAQLINSRAGLEGTIEYCAPEVLRGEPYTEKCDIWSYGVVAWELLNRQRPFADADVPIYILMMALGTGSLSLAPLTEEASSPGLVRLVERCLARQPADRPSFREILHTLENEYKVARGKAAAVPRSDSANSVVVLGAHMQHSESVDVGMNNAQQQQPHHHHHPHPHHHEHHQHGAPPRPPVAPTPHMPAQVAHALGAGGRPAGGGLRGSPAGAGQRFSPGGLTGGAGDALSPSHEGSPGTGHVTSRLAQISRPGVSGGTPQRQAQQHSGAPGERSGSGRARMGRMSRARSTPLPAHMWFGEQGEGWDEDDGGADEEGDNNSTTSAASDASAPAAGAETSSPAPVISLLPPLYNIPEGVPGHEDGSLEAARSGSGSRPGFGSFGLLASETSDSAPAEAGGSAQGPPAHSLQGTLLTPVRPAAAASPFSQAAGGEAGAAGGKAAFSSPFDGFLPFSDAVSPETPRILSTSTAPSLEALQGDAALPLGGTLEARTPVSVSRPMTSPFSNSLQDMDPFGSTPGGQPASQARTSGDGSHHVLSSSQQHSTSGCTPAPHPAPVASRMSSPFSQAAPSSTHEAGASPRQPAHQPPPHEPAAVPQPTPPRPSLHSHPLGRSGPSAQQQYANSAPAAVHMGKTGSFMSPFAAMDEATAGGAFGSSSGAWGASAGSSGTEAEGGGWSSNTMMATATSSAATTSLNMPTQTTLDLAFSMQEEGHQQHQRQLPPASSGGGSGSHGVQPSRGASGALPLGLVGQAPFPTQLQALTTHMSMSLSMDAVSPPSFDHSAGHTGSGPSPRRTHDGELEGSLHQAVPCFPLLPELGAPAVLTRKASSSPVAIRPEALGPLSPGGTRSGRHSLDKLSGGGRGVSAGETGSTPKVVGSPTAGGAVPEGEVTVHQISWVKV